MNNKKIQAQMQIDVSFLSKGLSLTKDIQSQLDKVKFTGPLTKHFTDDLSKQFKAIETNYNKMISGLSKKGLSSKQYATIFEEGNLAIKKNIESIRDIGKALKEAYNSKEQKDLLKGLEAQKQLLIDIKKLQTSMKQSNAAGARATSKLKDEFGLDFNNSEVRSILKAVKDRRGRGDKTLTPKQSLALKTDDPAKVERMVKLYDQIISALEKVKIKQAEINGVGGTKGIEKRIALIEKNIITLKDLNNIDSILATTLSDEFTPNQDAATAAIERGRIEAEKAAKASQTFKEVLAQFGIVFSAASIARGFKELIKSSFDFYKSLDSALNEIYVVSNLTAKEVDGLKDNFINMAKETGMALDDVTRSAVLFYQQGLNTNEVMEMTKVTAQFAKVAGIDATDAADKLTAAVNGYCLSAENAAEVADKFNKVAAVSAADINELSTAFSKAAAQANQAGVSMDNYLAYIATMEEATREAPENLGTSLKTIFSRMQQIKTGENTEDSVDVNAVETALRSVNIQLRDADGQLRDLEEIFGELGPKWNTLDRNTQAYLGTIIAGTRQQSRFITLMQNWDRVMDLAAESENSAGQQALMHAKAMESIESKLNQLNVAWQEFVSNLADSSLFKNVIGSLTKILKLINSGNKPLALVALAITNIAKKLEGIKIPILDKLKGKKLKEIIPTLKDAFNRDGLSVLQDKTKQNQNAIEKSKDIIAANEAYKQSLIQAQQQETDQKIINDLKREELHIQELINKEEDNQNKLQQQQEDIEKKIIKEKERKQMSRGQKVSRAGMAITALGMMSGDANTAGAISTLGTGVTGVGQLMTGNLLGGLVSLGTAAIQGLKTVKDWKKNIEKKIKDAANEVNQSAEEYKNKRTQEKSLDSLLTKYDKLSRKFNRSASEQKELNRVIQDMGDTTGIDVVTDAYGNLSVNIQEVRTQLGKLQDERDKALSDLKKQEEKSMESAMGGLFNNTSLNTYLKEFFSTNRGEYRGLLKGIDDKLTDETRSVSSSLASTFSDNFKQELMKDLEGNAAYYSVDGLAETLLGKEESINTNVSKNEWNKLYSEIDFLKSNIDQMTFADVQNHLNSFYDTWSAKNNLTEEQWNMIVKSVNDTVFENSSLLAFYEEVETAQAKITGKYYEKANADLRVRELQAYTNELNDLMAIDRSLGHGATGIYALGKFFSDIGNAIPGVKDFVEDDPNEERLKKIHKAQKAIKEEQKKVYEDYKKQNPFLVDDEDVEQWLDAQNRVAETFKNVSNEGQQYLGSIQSLTDFSKLTAEGAKEYADIMESAMGNIDSIDGDAQKYNYLARYFEEHSSTMSAEVKKQWETILQDAFDNLAVATPRTLTDIANDLEDIGKKLIQLNDIVYEFKDIGAISFDNFKSLANILDTIDLKSLGSLDPTYIYKYIDAIHGLDLAYDENTGYITMNGKSLESLQEIQELETKSKLASMITELKASRATTEVELAYIDAQIDATQAAIEAAQAGEGAYVDAEDVKRAANKEFTDTFNKSVDQLSNDYKVDVTNQGKWSTAILSNLGVVSAAWSKYFKGIAQGGKEGAETLDQLQNKAKDLVKEGSDYQWEGTTNQSGIDWGNTKDGKIKKTDIIPQLNEYLSKLERTRSQYQATLDTTNMEIKLLEDMSGKDLSKLFGSGGGGKQDEKKIQHYIGQLKEIYNILNRIQMLEHRLSTLDTYADIAKGEDYGELLQQRLNYNDELLDQYKFLVSEQKQFTNGYKDFIGTVDGLEGVFDFDQFGQIIINWEKYNSLQSDAVEGEISLKEKADDVYNTYTSMMNELQGYFDKYISYLKNTLNLLNEMKDNYVDLESKAAAAVQEIYKKELDAKLEAIDKEMKALEELTQARQKANKERDNAKVLSGYQADLQRAMMDTSGASDANYIKAQQNISDKLDAMAEDKYSEMINDIKKELEEEKDVLQKNFDELFENQEWLYSYLENDIMSDKTQLYQLLQGTDDWAKKSPTEKWQDMKDWDTKFFSYAESDLFGKEGIKGLLAEIDAKETEYQNLDAALKQQDSKGDVNIVQTIETWAQKIANAAKSGNSGGGGGSGGGRGNSSSTSNKDGKVDDQSKYQVNTDYYHGAYNTDLLVHGQYDESRAFNTTDHFGVKYQPKYYLGHPLKSAGVTAGQVGITTNVSGDDVSGQTVWQTKDTDRASTKFLVWDGGQNKYFDVNELYNNYGNMKKAEALNISGQRALVAWMIKLQSNMGPMYAKGGFANFTGPAWLDGTPSAPEAVLTALQTKHFIDFTNTLDKIYSNVGQAGVSNASSVTIDNISFNVESMSSPEDGEKAFNAFVDKFKEIGDRTGLKVQTFKNTL